MVKRGVRTTPCAPSLSLPTSNCGLTMSEVASGAAERRSAGSTRVKEMKDRSIRQCWGWRHVLGMKVANIGAVFYFDARVALESPDELAVSDVNGYDAARSVSKQDVGDPPVDAPASRQRFPDCGARSPRISRAPASFVRAARRSLGWIHGRLAEPGRDPFAAQVW